MSCLTTLTNPVGPDSQASLCPASHTSLITALSRGTLFHAKPDWPDIWKWSQWGVLLYVEGKCIVHTGMCPNVNVIERVIQRKKEQKWLYGAHVFRYKLLLCLRYKVAGVIMFSCPSVRPVLVIALSQEPIDGLPPNMGHVSILQS